MARTDQAIASAQRSLAAQTLRLQRHEHRLALLAGTNPVQWFLQRFGWLDNLITRQRSACASGQAEVEATDRQLKILHTRRAHGAAIAARLEGLAREYQIALASRRVGLESGSDDEARRYRSLQREKRGLERESDRLATSILAGYRALHGMRAAASSLQAAQMAGMMDIANKDPQNEFMISALKYNYLRNAQHLASELDDDLDEFRGRRSRRRRRDELIEDPGIEFVGDHFDLGPAYDWAAQMRLGRSAGNVAKTHDELKARLHEMQSDLAQINGSIQIIERELQRLVELE
ncbi:MAG: hypothetical protein IT318_15980 [Anaerolineales bacterium]|nr:hypothetical protein [Anaerolineales bacterium]